MTVGERIKQRRIELGLSQEDLAKRMGYSGKSSVCKAETSDDNITTSKVRKFANALNCTESFLMGWEEEKISISSYFRFRNAELLSLIRNRPDIEEAVYELLRLPKEDVEFYTQLIRKQNNSINSDSVPASLELLNNPIRPNQE